MKTPLTLLSTIRSGGSTKERVRPIQRQITGSSIARGDACHEAKPCVVTVLTEPAEEVLWAITQKLPSSAILTPCAPMQGPLSPKDISPSTVEARVTPFVWRIL